MRMTLFAAGLLALAGAIGAPASARAQGIEQLPRIVQTEIRNADAACRRGRGRPGYEALELVRAEDISGDGVEDFFIDWSQYNCLGVGKTFCGSGGCNLQIFLSTGRNVWRKAFDEIVVGFELGEAGGKPAAILEMSGVTCGKPRSETCKRAAVGLRGQIQYVD